MIVTHVRRGGAAVLLFATLAAAPAWAQDARPWRTRVALGPQIQPSYPGADTYTVVPLTDLSRARGDDLFRFAAPDESASLSLTGNDAFQLGPVIGFQGVRRPSKVGAPVNRVGFSVELGGFVSYQLAPAFRLRGEVRQGVSGHRGLIGTVGADYIARDGDKWLFSLGPRATFANSRYQRAYFGVDGGEAARTGLPVYRAGGGLNAVGAAASALYQLTPRWGVQGFAKYDRLVDDAGRSPIVRRFGSRDQLSGGIALSYTFGRGVR